MRDRKIRQMQAKKLEDHEVILYPLITEKSVNMIEAENKLCFVVNKKATKAEVKRVVEETYAIKVDSVRVLNDMKGRKKAIVRVNKAFKADEVATKLGVI
ncbi:MAG: 50S ribosomal protein L23 [archaeon]